MNDEILAVAVGPTDREAETTLRPRTLHLGPSAGSS